MFSVQLFLAYFCAIQFSTFGKTIVVREPSLPYISHAEDLSGQDGSATLSSLGRTRFPIPASSMTLVLQRGRSLDPVALQGLVAAVAGALVDKEITRHGENASCDLVPFGHDLEEGVELYIWPSAKSLTWAQLKAVIHGLQLFQVDGKRSYSYHFEIHDSETLDSDTRIGWGNIGKPSGQFRMQLLGTLPTSLSSPVHKRVVNLPPATPGRKIFHISGSQLILALRPRVAVQPDSVEAILITSDAWVARKISIWGEDGDAPFIFNHGTGDKPYTRLIVWSSMVKNLTWGQLKAVIDGLWTVLVDQLGYQYTMFEIYDRKVAVESRLGWGTIMETGGRTQNPLIGDTPLNSTSNPTPTASLATSKRALQIPSARRLPASNVSHEVNAIIFQIPATDMKLVIQNLTNPPYECARRALVAMVLSAAAELGRDMDRFGEDMPSAGQEYVSAMPGVELRLLKIYRPPLGYLTYGQLRAVVLGLQLYMVFGGHPQAIQFKVLYDDSNILLGRGAVQAVWHPGVPSGRAADS